MAGFRKILSLILVVCLLGTLMPQFILTASAADDEDISQYSAFDALGIDTSEVPDGVDLDSTDNPYGRNTVTKNEVYELLFQNAAYTNLYGDDSSLDIDPNAILDETAKSLNALNTTSYTTTAVAAGHFTKSADGKKAQTVTVGLAGSSTYQSRLDMYFSSVDPDNTTNTKKGNPIELVSASTGVGFSDKDDIAKLPALLHNYTVVTAGDYDGDGVDEVAVFIPNYAPTSLSTKELRVYKLQIDDTYTDANAADYCTDPDHWKQAWTYSLDIGTNMVSMVSGDFNQDGVDDLGVTYGYYYSPTGMEASTVKVFCGSKLPSGTAMLQNVISLETPASIVRASLCSGDLDGDGHDELVLGGNLLNDIHDTTEGGGGSYKSASRYVVIYQYNGAAGNFTTIFNKNFDLFSEDSSGELVYPCMERDGAQVFYSLPLLKSNIAVAKLGGTGDTPYIYLDSLLFQYGDDGPELVYTFEGPKSGAYDGTYRFVYPTTYTTNPSASLDGTPPAPRYYAEYAVCAGDMSGGGDESIGVLLDMPAVKSTSATSGSSGISWLDKLMGTSKLTSGDPDYQMPEFIEGRVISRSDSYASGTVEAGTFDDISYNDKNSATAGTPVKSLPGSTSLCLLNTDNDTTYISYTGAHTVMYSNPRLLAVLASAPYFEDLDRDDLSGAMMSSTTEYGSTSSTGSGTTQSSTISVGAYVNLGIEFLGHGQAETSIEYAHGWTYETSSTSTLEQTVSYSAAAGQDSVVFYSIPMEVYGYYVYYPVTDSSGNVTGYEKQPMTVNIPHTGAISVMALDKYERIAADFPLLPQISGTLLTHTVGDPSSYPTSASGYENAMTYSGHWSGVDYDANTSGNGNSTTQEIAITEESETTQSHTDTIDFSLGIGFTVGNEASIKFSFMAGASLSKEWESGTVTVSSEGYSYSGTIYNLPAEAEAYGYYFAWKLFTYTANINEIDVPIVSYLVKDVTQPPALPEDFAQDHTKTTSSAIGLSWSYPSSKSVAGFQLYRYYDFPEGSGSYELIYVPASDFTSVTYDSDGNAIRHYQYQDTGLASYTEYSYQIQAVRANVPPLSIPGAVLEARTYPDKGSPTVTLNGVTTTAVKVYDADGVQTGTKNEYSLLVYPDTASTVSVTVTGDYTETPRYQWQKLESGVWKDLNNAAASKYSFSNTGVADEGEYRCRVNSTYDDTSVGQVYYITSYSPTFTLQYSLRTAAAEDFFVNNTDGYVSLTLKSAQTSHNFAPTGNVIFTITGQDYSADYTAALGSLSTDYTTTATLDLGDTDNDGDGIFVGLPDGVYKITAAYLGSRVFRSLEISDPVYYVAGGSSGYLLNMDTSFTYGDSIGIELLHVAPDTNGNPVTTAVNNATYTFEQWNGTAYSTYTPANKANEVGHPFEQSDGSFAAAAVGSFRLKATVGTDTVYQEFTVSKRPITLGFNKTFAGVYQTSVAMPTLSDLTILGGSMVLADEVTQLPVTIYIQDSSGQWLDSLNTGTSPGTYTLVPSYTTVDIFNTMSSLHYDISFVSTSYFITGPRYGMTLKSGLLNDDIVGTVSIVSPSAVTLSNGASATAATTATNNTWSEDGVFSGGMDLLLKAVPQTGYMVKSWTVETPNTKTVYNTSSTYFAYQTLANDTTITVDYQIAQTKLYFQASNAGGTVTPVDSAIKSGATVQPGAEFTFKATPAEGYHFVEWTLSGSTNSNFTGDYDAQTGVFTTTITMGSVDTILTGVFQLDNYALTLSDGLQAAYSAADATGGTVTLTGSGTLSLPRFTAVTVDARPGYAIDPESEWLVNGESQGSGQTSLNLTMMADTEVEVSVIRSSYDVSLEIDPADANNQVRVTADGSKLDLTQAASVPGGTALVFTAVPARGYLFDHWVVNDVSAGTDATLTISALAEAAAVKAVFKQDPTGHTVSISATSGGSLKCSVDYMGSGYGEVADVPVAPGGSANLTLYAQDKLSVNALPASSYMLRKWTVNNTVDQSSGNTLTIYPVSTDTTIKAAFVAKSYTTVYYTAHDNNGHISSAYYNDAVLASGAQVGNGGKLEITAQPYTNYAVDYWTIDGEVVENSNGEPFIGETLTVDPLDGGASVSVEVYFTALVQYQISWELTHADIDFDISPDSYNYQFPDGDNYRYARKGSAVSFTVTPKDGYRVTSLTVNGEAQTPDEDGVYGYTVSSLADDLDIEAEASLLYSVTAADAQGGSVTLGAEEAVAGEQVDLLAIPDAGYAFVSWTVEAAGGGSIDEQGGTVPVPVNVDDSTSASTFFTMPAYDVIVTAAFAETDTTTYYDVTVEDSEGGDASADLTQAAAGDTVTLEADVDDGYVFGGWTVTATGMPSQLVEVDDPDDTSTTFEMPAYDVTVTARFDKLYTVTVADPENGGATADPEEALAGDTVTLSAEPDSSYKFSGWVVTKTGDDSVAVDVDDPNDASTSFTMPAYDVTVTAVFDRLYTVTVEDPKHGDITADPEEAAAGDTVTLSAEPDSDYEFSGWTVTKTSDGSVSVDPDDPDDAFTFFTMPDFDVTVTAGFDSSDDGGSSKSGSTTYYTIKATSGAGGGISPSGTSSVKKGSDKTYTMTPAEGYEIEDVLVDGVSVGAVLTYTFENVKKSHTIEVSFKTAEAGSGDTIVLNPFTDVKPGDWFYDSVLFAYGSGLFTGASATAFSPDAPMTRAMLVTVLYRLAGKPAVTGESGFDDVKPGDWYADAVIWATQNGIVNGYGNGLFGTNDPISREQLAAILYRYAAKAGFDVSGSSAIGQFADRGSVSSYALDALGWAVGAGLVNGKPGPLLDPSGSATRAEVAAVLMRFIENIMK